MKKLLMLGVALAAAAACANTIWTGAGADKKWSNPDNWSNGVPTGSTSEVATLPDGDWEIEVDGTDIHYFYILKLSGSSGRVRLTGSGTLQYAASGTSTRRIDVSAGRELIVDGPTVIARDFLQYGRVTVRAGLLSSAVKGVTLYDGAATVVEGGQFNVSSLTMTNGVSSFRLKGGKLKETSDSWEVLHFDNGNRLSLEGGTFVTAAVLSPAAHPDFVPSKNVTIESLSTSSTALDYPAADCSFAGTYVVTNSATVKFTSFDNTTSTLHVNGRGTIYAHQFKLDSKKSGSQTEFDLEALYLGAGGLQVASRTATLRFKNGIRIGAFADWSATDYVTGKGTPSYVYYGPCVFDTKNPFDASKSHTITNLCVYLDNATALRATGGGGVFLGLKSYRNLDRLVVDGETDLALTSTVSRCLGVRTLSIGAGSSLKIWPEKGFYLDVSRSFAAAEGSIKLEFDPNFTTDRCPVAFLPEGIEANLAAFDATKVPAGLTLVAYSNMVYLADSTTPGKDHSSETAKWYWTGGAKDGILGTADNWSTKTALDNSTQNRALLFDGWQTPTILTGGYSYRIGSFTALADNGPVRISGAGTTRIGGGNDIASASTYPFVLDFTLAPDKGGNLIVTSRGMGSISLLRDIPTLIKPNTTAIRGNLGFSGDVRLRGTCSGPGLTNVYAYVDSEYSYARPHRLTLLPGAVLATVNQSMTIENACSFDVAETSSLAFGGTQLAFTQANGHVVDGTWTISCPLVATAQQSFRGSGTVKIASLADAAGGIELQESVTCEPGAVWNAATPVFCRGTPTLKTTAATSVTLGDQAIELDPHATLAVDTAAGDLTLNSPVTGDGNLTKKGTGSLVLGATGNVIDTLTVEAGAVTVDPSVAAGATKDVPFLTVRKLVGSLTIPGSLKLCACDNLDGTMTYSVRARKGLAVIVK